MLLRVGAMVSLCAACSAFGGTDEAEGRPAVPVDAASPVPPVEGGDGGGADASPAPPATFGLVDGSFEQSSATRCAGVVATYMTATPDPLAATGAFACRLCASPDAAPSRPAVVILSYLPGGKVPPGTYLARVSVRKPPAPAISTPDYQLRLSALRSSGTVAVAPPAVVPHVVPAEGYETREVSLTVGPTMDVDRLAVQVIVSVTPNECLIVDDIVLTRN